MSKKILLKNVRLSYEHIFKAVAFDDSQDAKFSASLIIPKNHPDLPAVKKAYFEAGKEAFPSDFTGTNWPRGYTCSLKDADKDTNSMGEILAVKNPEYAGCYILEANSTRRPVVVHRDPKVAISEEDGVIYSGCYVNVSLAAESYTFGKVKKGVKCYLNGVQFVRDGEPFGVDASNDFDVLDGGDDDLLG